LAENKNKKFEKNVKEVLNFTEKQRKQELNRAMLLMNLSINSKKFN